MCTLTHTPTAFTGAKRTFLDNFSFSEDFCLEEPNYLSCIKKKTYHQNSNPRKTEVTIHTFCKEKQLSYYKQEGERI